MYSNTNINSITVSNVYEIIFAHELASKYKIDIYINIYINFY